MTFFPKKFRRIKLLVADAQGQTAVEYVLMLAVVVIMIISVMAKVRDYMIADGTCPNDTVFCRLTGAYGGQGFFEGNFRYFTLKR